MSKNLVKFFSYVVKENQEGLKALMGRKKLLYEDAVLPDYELCIQTVNDVSDVVPEGSPSKDSPREIMKKFFRPDYELFTIRKKKGANVPGKIWYISPEELEYLREWEMIDYGMSDDIYTKVVTEDGDMVSVYTYGLVKFPENITRVIDSSYIREEIPTKTKIARKRQCRLDYIEKKKNISKNTNK